MTRRSLSVFRPITLSAFMMAMVVLSACRSAPNAAGTNDGDADSDQSVLIMGSELRGGPFLPAKISIDYEEAVRTSDGRLRVRVNIRNRRRSQLEIQVQTLFKDDDWSRTGEMVDWKLIRLGPGETRRYEATSESPAPTRYTVRIRPFR